MHVYARFRQKMEFVYGIDQIQNTLHASTNVYAKQLESYASDIAKFLNERPFDSHFVVENKI